MNRLFLILIVVINLTSCAFKKPDIPSSLDLIHIQNATNFAKVQFESYMTGKFVPLTKDIATPKLVREWSEVEEQRTSKIINENFGDLQELKIVQTVFYDNSYIYRFKAKYSKLEDYSEIRVYTNLQHKVEGYILKPVWLDKYTKYKPGKIQEYIKSGV